jgi:heme/copper-type cytochrome/quinol oxidase subunit 4
MHVPHHIDSAYSLVAMTFGVIVIPVIVIGTLFLAASR